MCRFTLPSTYLIWPYQKLSMVFSTLSIPMLGYFLLKMQKHTFKDQADLGIAWGAQFQCHQKHVSCFLLSLVLLDSHAFEDFYNSGLTLFLQLTNLLQENESISSHGFHMILHTEIDPEKYGHWFYWTQLTQPLRWRKKIIKIEGMIPSGIT